MTIRSSPTIDIILSNSSIGRSFQPDNVGIVPPFSAWSLSLSEDTMRLLNHASNSPFAGLPLTIFKVT
uniref:Uncharacterized protein n=1 Tax=Arundo donax TaxID=35708 RepID=A0A0A9DNX5_ARUDO